MIEILAALLDAVVKAIPGVKDHRARQKHAEIGASLLMFYNDANRMLLSGEALIRALGDFEELVMSLSPDYEFDDIRRHIRSLVREQALTVRDIQKSFLDLGSYLGALVDNDSFRRLSGLFEAKFWDLDYFDRLINEPAYIPLDTISPWKNSSRFKKT